MKKVILSALLCSISSLCFADVLVTSAALAGEALSHPGKLNQRYAGRGSIKVEGTVKEISGYIGGKAVAMYGVPKVEHGKGSLVQLNPANDDVSLIAGIKEDQKITAMCASVEEVLPGYPLLTGCRFTR